MKKRTCSSRVGTAVCRSMGVLQPRVSEGSRCAWMKSWRGSVDQTNGNWLKLMWYRTPRLGDAGLFKGSSRKCRMGKRMTRFRSSCRGLARRGAALTSRKGRKWSERREIGKIEPNSTCAAQVSADHARARGGRHRSDGQPAAAGPGATRLRLGGRRYNHHRTCRERVWPCVAWRVDGADPSRAAVRSPAQGPVLR